MPRRKTDRIFDFRFWIFDRRALVSSIENPKSKIQNHWQHRLRSLPGDERGAISLLTLVTVMGLMLLLGMIINIARHADDKVRMQNSVDASAYSGGVVLARGMNALAFSNHLLCDVFALTAYMREARDRNAEAWATGQRQVAGKREGSTTIPNAWLRAGQVLSGSKVDKFARIGQAIPAKVQMEIDLVKGFSDLSAEVSARMLPVLEYVLEERLIPEFQRQIVQTIPRLAQDATNEVARQHGISMNAQTAAREQARGPQVGVLWRTSGHPVAYPDELDPMTRTLPAFDPTPSSGDAGPDDRTIPDPTPDPREGQDFQMMPNAQAFVQRAVDARERFAKAYLCKWTCDRLRFFPVEAKMTNFFNLWRTFTCNQLDNLLHTEYPQANLPHLLRPTDAGSNVIEFEESAPPGDSCDCRICIGNIRLTLSQSDLNAYLDRHFMFLGIVYRPSFTETSPAFFRNPLQADPLTFAQISLFVPRRQYMPQDSVSSRTEIDKIDPDRSDSNNIGGGFGTDVMLSGGNHPPLEFYRSCDSLTMARMRWDLWNQNWCVQLVPATSNSLAGLLRTPPPAGAVNLSQPLTVKLPNLGNAGSQDIRHISNH